MSDVVHATSGTCPQAAPYGGEQSRVGNLLLQTLLVDDFAVIAPYLTRISLQPGTILADAGDGIDDVYFVEATVVGLVDVLESGQRLAVALCGSEGFIGWPLLLGNDQWPHEAIVRAQTGSALSIKASDLMAIVDTSPRIRSVLLRYAMTLVSQMSRTIVSNLIHPVDRRTARWLLLYHDRVHGDEITITHEELGVMLGVRRSSITDALHHLEGVGAVRGRRGRLVISNRSCLEDFAGESYGSAEREYQRLLSPTWPRHGSFR